MAVTQKRLALTQPGTTIGTLYTVPTSTSTIVKSIKYTNTTGTDAKVDLYYVPSAGAAGAANKVTSQLTVPANGFVREDCSDVLNTGDTIQAAQVTSGAITVTISGVEVA